MRFRLKDVHEKHGSSLNAANKIKCLLPNDKRALASEQNLLLVVSVFLLLLLKHFDLLEAFEGESNFTLELHQFDTSEATHAQSPNTFQFIQLDVTEFCFS